MFDLINNGGDGNGIGMEEGTQAKAYDIDEQPLFDVSSANYTTIYADGQGEDESEDDEDIEAARAPMFQNMWRWTPRPRAPPPWPRRRRYQRGPQVIDPMRMFAFADLGLQLANTPFLVSSKRARPTGGG
jgi:hypothetical protein